MKRNIKNQMEVFQENQKRIALSTLRMSNMGANIMGGMTKEQARDFLLSLGYTAAQIAKVES